MGAVGDCARAGALTLGTRAPGGGGPGAAGAGPFGSARLCAGRARLVASWDAFAERCDAGATSGITHRAQVI
jgi:hypothetical protein